MEQTLAVDMTVTDAESVEINLGLADPPAAQRMTLLPAWRGSLPGANIWRWWRGRGPVRWSLEAVCSLGPAGRAAYWSSGVSRSSSSEICGEVAGICSVGGPVMPVSSRSERTASRTVFVLVRPAVRPGIDNSAFRPRRHPHRGPSGSDRLTASIRSRAARRCRRAAHGRELGRSAQLGPAAWSATWSDGPDASEPAALGG